LQESCSGSDKVWAAGPPSELIHVKAIIDCCSGDPLLKRDATIMIKCQRFQWNRRKKAEIKFLRLEDDGLQA
jgi:hypothetical protein